MAILLACAPAAPPATQFDGYSLRDSAGVAILLNTAPAWGKEGAWTVTPEPWVTIGEEAGLEEYLLHQVAAAVRLRDGRILVANQGTQELRFFGPDGGFLGAVGSDGEGPGEFRGLGFIYRLRADSLAVLDYRLFRFSVFDLRGVFARSFRIGEGGADLPFPEGFFDDGTILAAAHGGDRGDYSQLGWFREEIEYRRYDREGRLLQPMVTLPGQEMYRGTHPDGSGFTRSTSHGLRVWAAVGPASWFYAPADAWEYQERSREGHPLKIVRLDRERRTMPPAVDADREARVGEPRPRPENRVGTQPLPDRLPAYETILLDRVGNLWIAEYRMPEEPYLWQVFDPAGRWLGEVEAPPGGRVTEIGDDYLLGVWSDELGVEQVRLYGLVKPGGA